MENDTSQHYLVCEHKFIFALLMMTSGMMGAYTFNIRGGVFCNAQTANIVIMSIAFGKGEFLRALYFLIPISAYLLGTIISELMPFHIKKIGLLRWDTCFIIYEMFILFLIGFMPLAWPHQIVQVIINFTASMQYNTFRQAEGIPMATTFCTNHVRQVGISCARIIRKRDHYALKKGLVHIEMLLAFFIGGACLTYLCHVLSIRAIWLALIPLGIALYQMVKADLTFEHELLQNKPHGH